MTAARPLALAALVALMGPLSARASAPATCLGPASAALGEGRASDALRLADEALADAACAERALELRMVRALALHQLAEVAGGEAWCGVREAYRPARRTPDPAAAQVAAEGFAHADARCRAWIEKVEPDAQMPEVSMSEPPAPLTLPPAPPVEVRPPPAPAREGRWLSIGGVALSVTGCVVLGFGIADALNASLDARAGDGARADRAEMRGRAVGLTVGGGLLLAGGVAGVVLGQVVATPAEAPDGPRLRLEAGPAGARLTGRF